MDIEMYHHMSDVESRHWWYCGRRDIVKSLLRRFASSSGDVLDVGCGTGGNLLMLQNFGSVTAMEPNNFARNCAQEKQVGVIFDGKLPNALDVEDDKFSIVTMLDVLEHIEEDFEALVSIRKKVRKNGIVLVTVPALNFLMGEHDKRHHHFRRYSKYEIENIFRRAGFEVEFSTYFNFVLFPIAFFQRFVMEKVLKLVPSALEGVPATPLNSMLYRFFSSEAFFLKYIRFPFGLSIVLIARKK